MPRNIAENFNRLSRGHERYRRQTDDRQTTDGRAITYSEREPEFTFANKMESNLESPREARDDQQWMR